MQSIRTNAVSGFLVFLIALPLCLGIAMASGFPPVAGVLTAVVGGLLTSHTGGSPLTIKGPAAGLIVIALGAVQELGMGDPVAGYRRALAVGVIAGALQIVFGLFKAGRLARIMPPSVVHGMLAAIGIIIIAKQTPVMLGVMGAKGEPLEMLLEIPHYVSEADPLVAALAGISLALLVFMPRLPIQLLKKVPPPMMVLLVTVPVAAWLHFGEEHTYAWAGHDHTIGPKLLVQLPGNLLQAITFPDFSMVTSAISLKYIAMFALVGTVESLLSVIAVDAMDPAKHASDLDRDLLVTGVANLAAASIGGLPMISEIVRSKANIDAGATSSWSNFFHGAFLLLFVALVPGLLQMIPLAALAAMLVVTGTRLASPSEFRHVWHVGKDQFALFFTTLLVTLATDLLVGVAAGLTLKVAMHTVRGRNVGSLFRPKFHTSIIDNTLHIAVFGPLVFTNLLTLQRILDQQLSPAIATVRLDLTHATLLDHTVQTRLKSMSEEWPSTDLTLVGLDQLSPVSPHPQALRRSPQVSS